ncbi:unnamed protein product [Clonostachys chloroleuca]|uniref:Uncharacterized protein n=1 Tax=Clonostachys chloroleuca TaxID=1926264 RepID=A0AA35PY81_9HYPO|nr:unnamed protein product [Clonostachys chloroleuca]
MAKQLLFLALLYAICTEASPVGLAVSTPLPQVTSTTLPPAPTLPTKPAFDTATTDPTGLPPTPTSDDCSTRTVCVDGINECGEPWGTCIPDCQPWNISTPPCSTFTPPPMCSDSEPGQGIWLCKDFIDPCHQMYGGCYDVCKPEPSWYTPPCDKPWPTDGNFWVPEPTPWEPSEVRPDPDTGLWDGPRPMPIPLLE